MKFQSTRNDLLNKLNFASRIATSKSLISALSGVLLEASDKLYIYSTDLETSIKSSINANIIERGRAVVPAKVFINILRNFPESKINVELDINKNQLKVQCDKSNFYLNTFAIDEYPEFPQTLDKIKFSIDFDIFKKLSGKAIKSASNEDSRAILTGVLIEVGENEGSSTGDDVNNNLSYIRMVGTDSYRLSCVEEKINYNGNPIKVVIPSKVLDSIIKSDFGGKIMDINIEENQASFTLKDSEDSETMIISRLLSGKFPEYGQLIPKEFKHNIILNKEKVLEVIRRISSIAQDNIPVKIELSNGKMLASMNIKEIGSSSEEFEVSYGEEKIDIAFNPAYFIDGVSMVEDENLVFSIEESLKPVLIKNINDNKFIYLLMPIRIS
ncbi:MAG: DNA polymerase III subunit beta [Actinobacteria bacterium]|nr:DNA polymerase III subunit beta [Cyanobacteriota bacterium]MCL5772416.1 DNA polymerase III subunit beta [Actinomycetota bacterium]